MVYLEGGVLRKVVPFTNQEKEVKVSGGYIDKDLVSFADFVSCAKQINYFKESEKFRNAIIFDY